MPHPSPSASAGSSGVVAVLAVLVAVVGFTALAGPGGRDREASTGAPAGDGTATGRAENVPPPPPVLDREEVCRDAGYLCAGLAERGEPLRVVRWSGATPEIRVLVPLPAHEDAALARELQAAAARGIRAWNGHPFPIRVDLRSRVGSAPDITVRWATRLGATELGIASTRWERTAEGATMRVADFALTTRSPWDDERRLSTRQVELTAAHEMGHALGLPHSDEERDVMYPTNTASALTARDYRAMETLYRLVNGAEIH